MDNPAAARAWLRGWLDLFQKRGQDPLLQKGS
jgi:hypothetical protein